MRKLLFVLYLWVFLSPFTVAAQTPDAPVILIYESSGNKSDRTFIDMARRGAERAHGQLGIDYVERAISPTEDRQAVFEKYAESGAELIVALGFQNVPTVVKVAEKFPATYFSVIDGSIPPLFNNVQSITFRDNEGAFLVGMIAAMHSKNRKIGFIGGMDVPVIRDFAYGFQQGAEYIDPQIEVLRDMIGTTPEAWEDPQKAKAIAHKQIAQGADILFAAAGGSSIGMLEKAAEYENVYSIGVDTNQNGLFPGSMLTSLVKRVDKAVYDAMQQSHDNTWKSGIRYMGIREGALDYAVDTYNRNLLSKESVDKVEYTKDLIIRGLVKVGNYRAQ